MTYYMINMLKHNKLSLQQSNFDVTLEDQKRINNLDFNPEMFERQNPLPFHSPMKGQQTSTDWSLHRGKGHWWLLTTLTVGILGRNQATKIDGESTPPPFIKALFLFFGGEGVR